MNVIIHIKKAAQTNLNSLQTSFAAAYTRISNNYQPFYCNLTKFVSPALQPKPQQIHHPEFFPALRAKIIDILNANICLPSVIPAIFFVIPVEMRIQIIQ